MQARNLLTICLVRSKKNVWFQKNEKNSKKKIQYIGADFWKQESIRSMPQKYS